MYVCAAACWQGDKGSPNDTPADTPADCPTEQVMREIPGALAMVIVADVPRTAPLPQGAAGDKEEFDGRV
jgi:hypothetical protein